MVRRFRQKKINKKTAKFNNIIDQMNLANLDSAFLSIATECTWLLSSEEMSSRIYHVSNQQTTL